MPRPHRALIRLLRTLAVCAAIAPFAASAQQAYPDRMVKIVVPYPGGGGIDALGRALAQKLSAKWGQPVVVENRPGAATIAGAEAVARAPADGYTLMLTSDTTVAANSALYSKLPYNAAKSFQPIIQLVQLNQILLTRPAVAKTLADALRQAKAHPGQLNYASYGSGSQPHLAMEMLKNKAGVFIVHIPYRGLPQALSAVLGGEVEFTFSGAATSLGQIQAGHLQPLAIGGANRLPLLPNVPTFAELGYPDVPAFAWFGLFAPAGIDPAIVAKISADIREIAADPDFQKREVQERGYEPKFGTPEEFARAIEADRALAARAVKISGATVD